MKLFRPIMPSFAGVIAAALMAPSVALAEGMPQLDFKSPLTISQVVWGVIIFAVLYRLLSKNGLPLVDSVLAERAEHIGRDLESANAAKAGADAGMEEAAAATARARAESQAAIATAIDQAKAAAFAESETLNARLEERLREAETQIAQARTAAMGALRQVAAETATTVVTRLTGSPPDAAQVDSAVVAALSARGAG
jgi:F-type H+-transporting ATPase subunit b